MQACGILLLDRNQNMGLCLNKIDSSSSEEEVDCSINNNSSQQVSPRSKQTVGKVGLQSESSATTAAPSRTLQKRSKKTSPKRTKRPKNQSRSSSRSSAVEKNNSADRWKSWELSEKSNRKERLVKKHKFHGQYRIDDLKKGTIVYDERRGFYKDEIVDVEIGLERSVKKQRRQRRQRRINESLNWNLGF
jgi:hypothetical protein